jgi:type II secretory pathway component PulC
MAVRRWHVAVTNLSLLGVVAYLAGDTVSTLLPHPRAHRVEPSGALPRAPSGTGTQPPRTHYDVIERRDIFAVQGRDAEALADFRLVGTGTQPPIQFAVIEDRRTREQRLYRRGESLGSEADDRAAFTIVRIEDDRVVVGLDGETFVLARAEPARTEAGAAEPPAAEPAAEEGLSGDVLVRRGRDDEYLIDRRDVHESLADVARVTRQFRAVPNFVDGEPTGYRVFGIDRGSLFERLGLRNGDVIRGVNAIALTNPAQALALLSDLPRERELTVDVLRGKQARTLRYEIR